MQRQEEKIENKRDHLTQQFARMEEAIAQSKANQDQLSAMLGNQEKK